MTDLVLYNHFHNGDLFASKGFVLELCRQLEFFDVNIKYLHANHPKVLSDLPVEYAPILSHPVMKLADVHRMKIFMQDDVLYVNTWIGPYISAYTLDEVTCEVDAPGINYQSYQYIWKHIFSEINKLTPWSLQLNDNVWQHVPTIRQDRFPLAWMHAFLNRGAYKFRVLVSNGPVHSGQAYASHNMIHLLLPMIQHSTDVQWIFTANTGCVLPNVVYTGDIIPSNGAICDLNEIGLLSEHCDIIIGRNSGPFLFTNTQRNLADQTKTFIALGKSDGESFPWNLTTPARFYWMSDHDDNKVQSFIETVLHAKHHFT